MSFPVVLNDEEQYSLRPAGFEGPKEDRLARIARVWTDMRPLSVRQAPA